MSKMDERFDRLENKIDSIDTKLDDHLGKFAATVTDVSWIKAHLKLSLSVAIAVIGTLVLAYSKSTGLIP